MHKALFLASLALFGSRLGFGKVDNDLLSYVPPGTKILASLDADQARSSPFGQFVMQRMNADGPGLDNFIQQTGFDPRHDVQQLLIASSDENTRRTRFVVIARGTFDQDRLGKAAQANGASVQNIQGVTVYLHNAGQRHGHSGFAFPDAGTAILGDLASLRQVISARANPQLADPELQRLISRVGPSNDAWFVSLVPGTAISNRMASPTSGPFQGAQVLQSVVTSSGGIHFGDLVQFSIDAQARSAKDATSLADVVRFLASLAQMNRDRDPKAGLIAPTLDAMTLTTSGDNVHVSLSMPEQTLEQLAELKTKVARNRR
jgi:hypothetical protein